MDNQNPTIYPNNPYANPQPPSQDPLMASSDDDDENQGLSTLKKVILIISVLILMVASGVGGYYLGYGQLNKKIAAVQDQDSVLVKSLQAKVTSLNNQVTNLQNAAKESDTSNVIAKIPVATMTTDIINFLTAYNKANGEYPASPNTDLNNLLSTNNYEFKTTGTKLSCPTDARFFTYSSTPNTITQKYDNFTLTYCNASAIATVTQATMDSTSMSTNSSSSTSMSSTSMTN